MKKDLLPILSVALLLSVSTSCMNNTPDDPEPQLINYSFTIDNSLYNADGYWYDVYNPTQGPFGIAPAALFSHKASVDVFDGVEYKSFTGFCPSIVTDPSDYTGQDWTKHQFASIANSAGQGYLIAHWDVRENDQTPLADRSCLIDLIYTTQPVSMTFSNTSYAYYAMKNGTAFSKPFDSNDYLILDIYGVYNKQSFLGLSVQLTQNGEPIDGWHRVDLTPLGKVQQIYFTMRSSDTGQYGMNVPAYFALGDMSIMYNVE